MQPQATMSYHSYLLPWYWLQKKRRVSTEDVEKWECVCAAITESLEKTTWKFLKVLSDLIPWVKQAASQEYGDAVNEKQLCMLALPPQ